MTSLLAITFILIFSTSFIKILTSLSIFQYGLGLKNFAFSIVVFVLSIILSIYLIDPVVSHAGGWEKLLSASADGDLQKIVNVQEEYFSNHIKENADPEVLKSLETVSSKNGKGDLDFLLAFFITELKQAFYIGLLFIIPFVIIDLLITNVLMALGITQISSFTIALPAKILLFYLVDGWSLLFEKILTL